MNIYPYCQEQQLLFPPRIKDKLPDDHLAVIINDIIEELDLSALYEKIPLEGHPSYHPKMLLKVLVYAYATGTFSSRKIAKALYENIAYIYLSGWQAPDFRTISDFRKDNIKQFKEYFKQVVDLCNSLGMIKLGHIAIDGTKIKANASDARTYDKKRIDKEIEKLFTRAKETDEKEDRLYGKAASESDVPQDIRKRDERIKRLRQLKEKLTQSGKEKINATDHDAAFMKTRSGIKTSHNVQAAVDEECMLIIANDVVSDASDVGQLEHIVDQSIEHTGQLEKVSADAGYSSGENLLKMNQKGIDAYIPDREYQATLRKGKNPQEDPFHKANFTYDENADRFTCPAGQTLPFSYLQKRKDKEPLRIYQCSCYGECPHRNECTKNKNGRTVSLHPHEKELKAMREKLDSPEGKVTYAKRKKIVEPVFGVIKHVIGFTSFSLRGSEKVKGEFNLVSIAYNLKKMAAYFKLQDKCALEMINSVKYQTI